MVVLAVSIAYFAFDKFVLSESREAAIAEAAREAGRSEAVIDAYGERSIAVLAFADMSPDGDQEYMSDGIAEELLNLLAQLIEAGSDTHRWSETYDRKLENVFDIQDEIAAHVVEELKSALLGNTPKSQRVDEDTYTLVLRARYLWNRRAEGDEEQALELYQQAIAIDPDYAPAWTGLSVAYAVAALKERMDKEEGLRLAREAVEKALQIDPDDAEARVRLGQALARDGNWPAAAEHFKQAYAAEPNSPLTLGIMAQQAGRQGRIDEVVRLYDRAAAVDPLASIWHGNKAAQLIHFHRTKQAEVALERSYEMNGNVRWLREGMIDIHIVRGEYAQALELLDLVPLQGDCATRCGSRGRVRASPRNDQVHTYSGGPNGRGAGLCSARRPRPGVRMAREDRGHQPVVTHLRRLLAIHGR